MRLGKAMNQIAYAVEDVREFAKSHSAIYGSGPFLIIEDFEVACNVRGRDVSFGQDVAYGQWGEVQVEVKAMRPTSSGADLFHELFPGRKVGSGVHHLCSIVDDLEIATAEFQEAGFEIAFRASALGTNVVMFDCVSALGHFVELYPDSTEIRYLYDGVKSASIGFNGANPIRPIKDYMPAGSLLSKI